MNKNEALTLQLANNLLFFSINFNMETYK